MSFSGPSPGSWLIIFLFGLLTSSVSAFELGMSPAHIFIKGNAGEMICHNVSIIIRDYNGSLFLSSKWLPAEEKREIFEAYTLNAEGRGIGAYHNSIFLAESKTERVCVQSMRPGIYKGILMLQPGEGIVGIASKIEVKI